MLSVLGDRQHPACRRTAKGKVATFAGDTSRHPLVLRLLMSLSTSGVALGSLAPQFTAIPTQHQQHGQRHDEDLDRAGRPAQQAGDQQGTAV